MISSGVRKASMQTSPILSNLLESYQKQNSVKNEDYEDELEDEFDLRSAAPKVKFSSVVDTINRKWQQRKALTRRSKSELQLGKLFMHPQTGAYLIT